LSVAYGRPDISLARRLLGWEPRVPLEEGLTRTAEYYRARLAAGFPERRSGVDRRAPGPRT
jgi:UDP-glucuronate decarboxylase